MIKLPIDEPVIIFAIAMVIFLITPILMKKLRIPGIIGPILAGVIIGPHGFHLLERDQTIVLLGTIGLLFIIFIAGLELDIDGFKKYRSRSILFGSISFTIPLVLGTCVGLIFDYSLTASILLGSILGSHTLLAYPIASRLGIAKNKAVTTAVGGTLLTDTFALLILAVVTGAAAGQLSLHFWVKMTISLIVFVLIILWGTPILSRWFFRNSENEGVMNFTYVMVILFVSGFLAVIAGMQPIIGAFLAGLALNRFVLEHGTLMNRIRFLGNALFIPFFLLSVGMLMDLSVLFNNPRAWIITGAIVLSVIIGKALAPILISKIYNYSKKERNVMIGLTVPQAAATLASTLVGFEVGLLDQATVNAVIIMILITCIVGPYFVEKYGRKLALKEEQKPSERKQSPERVLIPLANPQTMESLLDLGNMIKHSHTDEQPLYPLTVVQKDITTAHDEVAQAEKMLGHAVMYAAGAEIPVRPITRVDQNVSNGIIRAIAEERINTVVIGWDAERNSNKLFGSVIDRFVDQTTQTVLVTKLGHPLQTTRRIILIIPYGADHKPGFMDALERIKRLTASLSASLLVLVINDSTDTYEEYLKQIKPEPPTEIRTIDSWKALQEGLETRLVEDDIIVILSARRGTVAWHPELEELPKKLAIVNPESFIIYYPREEEEVDIRGSKGIEVPKEVLRKKDYEEYN
ncbi:cation:proton antiporter [Ornithinibacillus sp. BX22]|uniref:Cation:proton antiporter n=2 Tax=Ornithinibacillus TaxID=484508 RepID=A0A923L4C3_9BACI|nr:MULTISPECIES: cation:proton antiporter [Ornithinibacillus]MBC5636222.1 cation:proton antiporter [Ornithinibacillus hominis]MBS3681062.1 cation:proton antiporter [Ornithinibacillus massiliensis]